MKERSIDYPVAVDNDYEIWSAFANHYWPALYFVDANGVIRDQQLGDHLYTLETYLGYGRSGRSNHWMLAGEGTIEPENVALDRAGGSITCRFHARDAHLVLSPGTHEPIPFRVLLDGEPPGPSHGVDVDEEESGLLADGRMYQLVRQHETVRQRTPEITFLEPGAEAYAFTFG